MAVSTIFNRPTLVEQGTSGIWTYRKWSDGVAECFGVTSITISEWTSWGNMYYSKPTGNNVSYPSGLFKAHPCLLCTAQGGGADAWAVSGTSGSKDQTDSLYFGRATTGPTGTKGMILHAIGKWK